VPGQGIKRSRSGHSPPPVGVGGVGVWVWGVGIRGSVCAHADACCFCCGGCVDGGVGIGVCVQRAWLSTWPWHRPHSVMPHSVSYPGRMWWAWSFHVEPHLTQRWSSRASTAARKRFCAAPSRSRDHRALRGRPCAGQGLRLSTSSGQPGWLQTFHAIGGLFVRSGCGSRACGPIRRAILFIGGAAATAIARPPAPRVRSSLCVSTLRAGLRSRYPLSSSCGLSCSSRSFSRRFSGRLRSRLSLRARTRLHRAVSGPTARNPSERREACVWASASSAAPFLA
jgi:hypothetical protein